jgi:hypothetical protein
LAKGYVDNVVRVLETKASDSSSFDNIQHVFAMRWLFSFIFVALWSLVHGLSSSGSKLLVVVDDATEQDKYSQLWGDLKGALNRTPSNGHCSLADG